MRRCRHLSVVCFLIPPLSSLFYPPCLFPLPPSHSVFPSLSPSLLTVIAQGTNEVDSLPIITRHPEGVVVAPQDVVTLFCEASGDNQPILFTHNGNLINENDPAYSFATDRLTLNGVIESLQGEYVCLASNRIGNRTFTVASAPALVQLQGTVLSYAAVCVLLSNMYPNYYKHQPQTHVSAKLLNSWSLFIVHSLSKCPPRHDSFTRNGLHYLHCDMTMP